MIGQVQGYNKQWYNKARNQHTQQVKPVERKKGEPARQQIVKQAEDSQTAAYLQQVIYSAHDFSFYR